jgi:hypothetical protein
MVMVIHTLLVESGAWVVSSLAFFLNRFFSLGIVVVSSPPSLTEGMKRSGWWESMEI